MTQIRTIQAFLSVLLLALCLGVIPSAAQTITNIARASWTETGVHHAVESNTVSFPVARAPVRIETFTAQSAGEPLSMAAPMCGNGASLAAVGKSSHLTAIVEPSSVLHSGAMLYFRVSIPDANRDPALIDRIVVTVASAAGDREELLVYETAPNSGEFAGAIRTSGIPPQPVSGDCVLQANGGDRITLAASLPGVGSVLAVAQMNVLADPYGIVFDSESGAPVSGARLTIVDAATGVPAAVFAEDGKTRWPSTMIAGQAVVDGAGNVHAMGPGQYWFPRLALGTYRIVVEPPAPFVAPSVATATQLATLRHPDGLPMQILPASFGQPLLLDSDAAVRVDIPLDPPAVAPLVSKTASRQVALPGDMIVYTVTVQNPDALHDKTGVSLRDVPSPLLRLRADSIRVDGAPAPGAVQVSPDGREFTVDVGTIPAGGTRTVRYAMTVRADAAPGTIMNVATVTDDRGRTGEAAIGVRILREDLAARMTLIGRITDGGCAVDRPHAPIAGVRVVLEDGSFAITDADGRYHFEGLVPGTHVAQVVTATLPPGGRLVDCASSTRSARNPGSRFVIGQGGSLVVADFAAVLPEVAAAAPGTPVAEPAETAAAQERKAAGGDVDWLAVGDGPVDFLFPAIDHNPRAPAVRVVIRHRADQTVTLRADGRAVDPVAFDGTRQAPGGRYAVSIWRGIPLDDENTRLTATVRGAKGEVAAELARDVHYAQGAARIELVPEQSVLVADGRVRPVLALRVLDRSRRPVRAGLTGEFQLSAPYESAQALDAMQQRALTGQGRAAPRWHVKGDDGMAYVELAPTMASGKLVAQFDLADGPTRRRIELETWIKPGQQPWTVVGLAEATAGAKSVAEAMQRAGRFDSDLGDDGRIAVYAKGPVARGVLLTAAYDSAKQRDDQQLMGGIDPQSYYTVFADMADRRADAASREKIHARIESEGFLALYGDFEAGFDQTQLARYQRTATGLKGELSHGALHVQAFGARIASSHRRDEFQGGGISGPYRLSSRAYVPGSEVVTIEVRDRFRSERIVTRRTLVRYVDYDIDLLSATITFKQPVLSRDPELNPQFIVIGYDVDLNSTAGGEINAGVRADITVAADRLRVGASIITQNDAIDTGRQTLAAVDVRARLGADTELRAEIGTTFGQDAEALAWLVEAEHHDGNLDLFAYARRAERDFGLGQTAGAELGRRKLGLDARYRLSDALALTASTWRDASLEDAARRTAVQLGASWHSRQTDARLGLAAMHDRLADGRTASSTVLEGGVTHRLQDNRLELSASSSIALDAAESIDLPARHRFGARYALTSDLRLVGTYELAKGEGLDARTARVGVEVSPWTGGRLSTTLGQQQISEQGKRSFAAFGLAQAVPVTANLTLDATLDANRMLSDISPADLVNPAHPASSGGHLGENGSISEDFTALALGGTWRAGRWTATMRGERRNGELADRTGLTVGTLRQLGEGSMLGGGFTWTRAEAQGGAASELIDGSLALAWRPAEQSLAILAKLQFRADRITGAVAGEAGPAGRGALTITGDGKSERLIASLSGSWTPRGRDDDQLVQRSEIGFFAAARHNFDSIDGFDLAGTTLLGGLDIRHGIGPRLEIGIAATARASLSDRTTTFAIGPQIGFSPAKDVLVMLGYNITGFRDPDFAAARTTQKGLFIALRMKFDDSLLGLTGPRR